MNVNRLQLLYPNPSLVEQQELIVLTALVKAAKEQAKSPCYPRWPLDKISVEIDHVLAHLPREFGTVGKPVLRVCRVIELLILIEKQRGYLTVEGGLGAIRVDNHLFKEVALAWHKRLCDLAFLDALDDILESVKPRRTELIPA